MSNKPDGLDGQTQADLERYWRNNKRIIAVLLTVWFLVSCVLGIFFVEPLNAIKLGGFPLGFWIAQQGSIYVFILLIAIYCIAMEIEDRRFHVREQKQRGEQE